MEFKSFMLVPIFQFHYKVAPFLRSCHICMGTSMQVAPWNFPGGSAYDATWLGTFAVRARICSRTHSRLHTDIQIHTHMHTHTHTLKHKHTQIRTCAHAHTIIDDLVHLISHTMDHGFHRCPNIRTPHACHCQDITHCLSTEWLLQNSYGKNIWVCW